MGDPLNSTLLPVLTIVFAEQKKQVSFTMAIGNVEVMQKYSPNTSAWEQQDWNKTMKQRKNASKKEWKWNEVNWAQK